MNCKQGDLAIIVGILPGYPGYKCNGMIVKCVSLIPDYDIAAWIIEPEIDGFLGVADVNLRPIRDPGDDAVDEMVQLHGKPVEVTA